MLSCFKSENSNLWDNGIESNHTDVYISTSGFCEENVPKISTITESLKKYDVFKYAAYRTAFKLHTIRKVSKLHRVDLSTINSILKDYENERNHLDESITLAKAHNLMCTAYTEAAKKVGFTDEPNQMALLFIAFLQNTYMENEKPLLFIHLKIAVILFSAAKLSEKFKYLFHSCSNGSTISKESLSTLFICLTKMAELVGEQLTFGSHLVKKSVKSLLKFSKGNISLKMFQKWILLEPQSLVWISTMHRIAASETTQHFVSCDYCLINPIVGFRYRCNLCINYNLCQNCFLHGCINKRHKEKHPVQEFCHSATKWEEVKAIINTLKNNFPFVHCPSKAYLSFDEDSLCENEINKSNQQANSSALVTSLKKSAASDLIKELTNIIKQLEEEQRNQHCIGDYDKENKQSNVKTCNAFTSNLDLLLQRLKGLLQSLEVSNTLVENQEMLSPVPHVPFNKMNHYFESTPLNSAVPLFEPKPGLSQFSDSNINFSQESTEKPLNHSTSLDFTSVMSSVSSGNFTDSDGLKYSSVFSQSTDIQSSGISFQMKSDLYNCSTLNLSEKIPPFDESKISPLYLSSINSFSGLSISKSVDCNYSVTPIKKSVSTPSITRAISTTFTLNKTKSLEEMEMELQAMLLHIEELLPEISGISNTALEKKVISTLSDMETSVKKLSHLSIALSAGSTDI